ncbi:hypothetical protein Pfo_008849 [Paulownia fortunei]|nr:hypothetical protein Pfo_008849 [Paulownia fortunei]
MPAKYAKTRKFVQEPKIAWAFRHGLYKIQVYGSQTPITIFLSNDLTSKPYKQTSLKKYPNLRWNSGGWEDEKGEKSRRKRPGWERWERLPSRVPSLICCSACLCVVEEYVNIIWKPIGLDAANLYGDDYTFGLLF